MAEVCANPWPSFHTPACLPTSTHTHTPSPGSWVSSLSLWLPSCASGVLERTLGTEPAATSLQCYACAGAPAIADAVWRQSTFPIDTFGCVPVVRVWRFLPFPLIGRASLLPARPVPGVNGNELQ
jgi:hypothetical protein